MIELRIIDDMDGWWTCEVEGLEVHIFLGEPDPVQASGAVWEELRRRQITESQILRAWLRHPRPKSTEPDSAS